jgi:FMN reductase
VEVEIIELRDWARDLTNNLLTGFPSPGLAEVLDRVARSDALIAVSPIFSASYSGLFKMFFDVLAPDVLIAKPILIAATGGSARHSLALEHAFRPLFSYLRSTVVPTAVYAASEDWASEGELRARIDRASGELARLVLPISRTVVDPVNESEGDTDGDVIPFTRLLAAQRSAAVQQHR